MPISKKPRSKTVVKTSPKASALAALPDKRAMESFLTALGIVSLDASGRRSHFVTASPVCG